MEQIFWVNLNENTAIAELWLTPRRCPVFLESQTLRRQRDAFIFYMKIWKLSLPPVNLAVSLAFDTS